MDYVYNLYNSCLEINTFFKEITKGDLLYKYKKGYFGDNLKILVSILYVS